MSRQKRGEENIRKIQFSNGSYYVRVPIELIRQFKWQEGQKLVVEQYGENKILIKDWDARM